MSADVDDASEAKRPDPGQPVHPAHRLDERSRRRLHRSWYIYDWANSGYVTTTSTVLLAPYMKSVAEAAVCPNLPDGATCAEQLSILGIAVSPGSLPFYVTTFATIASALVLPIVGALADRSTRPRLLMSVIAWVGAAAAASMALSTGGDWALLVAAQLVAVMCLGASMVVYDAILVAIATPDERDQVSSKGWSVGYLGGFTLLVLNLALVTSHESVGLTEGEAVRWSLLSAGLWWAVFTVVPFIGLRKLPSGPVARVPNVADRGMVAASFGQLAHTLRHLAGYRNTWMFLFAYLLFNDGIQTVIASASVFGEAEIGLDTEQLLTVIAVVQAVAFVGALLFGRIAGRLGAKRTILIGLVLWSGVSATGFFLPRGQFVPFLTMSIVIGLVLGGTQALSRSLFSQLIPAGREAEYFSLYQAAERGTSWFGTLLFGLVFQATGSYRPAVASLLVFFVLGGLLLSRVRVREGIEAAGNPVPAVI